MRFSKAASLVVIVVFGMAAMAQITVDSTGNVVFQQTLNNPCVIGDPSCNQPPGSGPSTKRFTYVSYSGTPTQEPNTTTYDIFSPSYYASGTAVAPLDTIPTQFTIGVDLNIAGGQGYETLVFFKTYDCGTSSPFTSSSSYGTAGYGGGYNNAAYGGSVTGGINLPGTCSLDSNNSYTGPNVTVLSHNGNGYSDYLIQGFSLTAGHYYMFEASQTNDTDGMEEFFIIPAGTPPVPEPATMVLFGSGLLGIANVIRRRLRS